MPKVPPKAKSLTAKTAAKLVDELGSIKAQLADLEEKANAIKAQLEDAGFDKLEGELFKYSFSSFDRTTIDYKSILEELAVKVPVRVLKKHTKVSPSSRATVAAR